MIKAIKTWWKRLTRKDFYVYVITVDGNIKVAIYDRFEAFNFCTRLCEKGVDNVEMHETEIV